MLTIGEHTVPRQLVEQVVDAVLAQLAVVDEAGVIVAVNRAWLKFATENGVDDPAQVGVGANYFTACENARPPSRSAQRAREGIAAVLAGEVEHFRMDYACPAYGRQRWFTMQVTPIHLFKPMAVVVHTDLTRRKAVERRLHQRLRRLADQMTDIEQAERQRLAAQLHDHLQQLLVAARLALCAAPVRGLSGQAKKKVEKASHYLDDAISATRSLSAQIRPLSLEENDLPDALHKLARQHAQLHDVPVTCDVEPPDMAHLPLPLSAFLYHSTRELLFNAIKHAHPSHQAIRLHCDRRARTLTVTVTDDGCGADPERISGRASEGDGTGLATIRQRLAHFGGRLDVDSAPGRGTAVTLTLPLRSAGIRREEERH